MAEKASIVRCGEGQRWVALHWGYEDCLRVLYTPPRPLEPLPTPSAAQRPVQQPIRREKVTTPSALGLENISLSPTKPKQARPAKVETPPRLLPALPITPVRSIAPPPASTSDATAIRVQAPTPNTSPKKAASPSKSYPSPPSSNPAFSPQEPIPDIVRKRVTKPPIETDPFISNANSTPDQSFTHIGSPAQLSSTAVSLAASHKNVSHLSKKDKDLGLYEDLLAVLKLRQDRPVLDSRKLSNVMKSRHNPPAWKLAGMS